MDKKERLIESYGYLRNKGIIHTQKEVSERMGYAIQSVNKAFAGKEKYLNDTFLSRYNQTFDNVFNLDWLQNGNGDMFAGETVIVEKVDISHSNNTGNGNIIGKQVNHNGSSDSEKARQYNESIHGITESRIARYEQELQYHKEALELKNQKIDELMSEIKDLLTEDKRKLESLTEMQRSNSEAIEREKGMREIMQKLQEELSLSHERYAKLVDRVSDKLI
jgi:vacuolar-type H+-ATPase subunit I/STV1